MSHNPRREEQKVAGEHPSMRVNVLDKYFKDFWQRFCEKLSELATWLYNQNQNPSWRQNQIVFALHFRGFIWRADTKRNM